MAASQPSTADIAAPVSSWEAHFRRITGTLRKRNFRLFWIGETTSQIGSNISSVVIPLVGVRVLHAGTFAVALLTGAVWLPWLFLGLPAGAWVDRFSKRTVMIICDLVSLVLFASVAACAWLRVLTLAQLLGHASTSILPTYVKALDENTRAVIDMLGRLRAAQSMPTPCSVQ